MTEAQRALAEMCQAAADVASGAHPEVALLRRQLDVACRRVDELREQVQTQINLRVAAEQRAGKRNVAGLEAEIDRLNELLRDQQASAAFGPWPDE